MKKIILIIALIILSCITAFSKTKIDFNIFSSSYAYNGENTHWEDTLVTLTYFENFTEASFDFIFNDYVKLTLGGTIFIPFSLELPQGIRFFPIVTTELSNEYVRLRIGTLTGGHNLPDPIMDPLTKMTPYIRATKENMRMPNGTEEYKYGKFTHGYYEYGISFEWFKGGQGEIYMNWQLMHTEKHRERFDVGLIHSLSFIEIFTPYIGLHYWHNGGHEYPFVQGAPSLTENYSGAIGINSKELSILYMASYNILDRDNPKDTSKFGQGLYMSGNISVFGWFEVEPLVFVSSWYLDKKQKFISIEGDPFFRVPFYAGLNLRREFIFANGIELSLAFINGIFLTEKNEVGGRYDQGLKFDFKQKFNIYDGEKNKTNI